MGLPPKCPEHFATIFLPIFNTMSKANFNLFIEHKSFLKKYWSFAIMIPSVIIFHITICASMLQSLENENFDQIADSTARLFIYTQILIKAVIIIPKASEIEGIFLQFIKIWRHPSDLTETQLSVRRSLLKRTCFFNKVVITVVTKFSWLYCVLPFLCTVFNRFVLKREYDMWLSMACRFPFDPFKDWPTYIGVSIFVTYLTLFYVYFHVGPDLFMNTLCALLNIEFTLLKEDLDHIRPMSADLHQSSRAQKRSFAEFVKRHQTLLQLSMDLDAIFCTVNFYNLICATVSTCLFLYAALFAANALNIAIDYLAAFCIMLLILNLCYHSELMITSSSSIAEAAYDNLWYKGDVRYRKNILYILQRAQIPSCMTAMNISQINLQTFGSVLKSAWTFMSVMSTVYGK